MVPLYVANDRVKMTCHGSSISLCVSGGSVNNPITCLGQSNHRDVPNKCCMFYVKWPSYTDS